MFEFHVYNISELNDALVFIKNKKVFVHFEIKAEELLALCRLFCFNLFSIKKEQGFLIVYLQVKVKKISPNSDYIMCQLNL